jgi:small-conductance mechanosensitive channel
MGLAVAFGSQEIVQDVVSGMTIVFTDLFDIGVVVEISGPEAAARWKASSDRNCSRRTERSKPTFAPDGPEAFTNARDTKKPPRRTATASSGQV